MNDAISSERMVITVNGLGNAHLSVLLEQMETVRQLLSSANILFSIERNALLMGGREACVIFNFGRSADVQHIQSILDSVD
jgi:hypothetical protein